MRGLRSWGHLFGPISYCSDRPEARSHASPVQFRRLRAVGIWPTRKSPIFAVRNGLRGAAQKCPRSNTLLWLWLLELWLLFLLPL